MDSSFSASAILDERQLEAVEACDKHRLMIVTGPPGCGKTHTVRSIVQKWKSLGEKIVLFAPTGQATQVLQLAVGDATIPAYTLNMCFHDYHVSRAIRNREACLVVDELSMVSLQMIVSFFLSLEGERASAGGRRTLKFKRLVLVGDVDQMGAVGGVSIAAALMSLRRVKVVRLERVWRQGDAASALARNIERLRDPAPFRFADLAQDDSFTIVMRPELSDERTRAITVRQFWEAASAETETRVLCMTTKTKLALNLAIQSARPESRHSAPIAPGSLVRFGDLVRCTRNYYTANKRLRVANGAVGLVKPGPTIEYAGYADDDGATEFDLGAYASTVHAAQGAESSTIVAVLDAETFRDPPRELLYTAVTRAKKQCVLLCTPLAASMLEKERKTSPETENLARQLKRKLDA